MGYIIQRQSPIYYICSSFSSSEAISAFVCKSLRLLVFGCKKPLKIVNGTYYRDTGYVSMNSVHVHTGFVKNVFD
jgi:hypothetical protein